MIHVFSFKEVIALFSSRWIVFLELFIQNTYKHYFRAAENGSGFVVCIVLRHKYSKVNIISLQIWRDTINFHLWNLLLTKFIRKKILNFYFLCALYNETWPLPLAFCLWVTGKFGRTVSDVMHSALTETEMKMSSKRPKQQQETWRSCKSKSIC